MLRYLQRETVGCGRRLLSKGSSAMSAYKKFALALTTSALVFAPSVAWAQESTTPVAAAPVPVVTTQDVQENDENDPLEGGNRVMFEINQVLDEVLLRPVAVVYKNVLPDFAQDGVRNFMNNLNSPVIFANDLLQGEAPAPVADRILRIRRELLARGASRVVLVATLPCEAARWGPRCLAPVRELNRRLRGAVPAADFLDLTALLADGAGLRRSVGVDGLHLGPDGYSLWFERLRSMV
jgi:hypothetical protein